MNKSVIGILCGVAVSSIVLLLLYMAGVGVYFMAPVGGVAVFLTIIIWLENKSNIRTTEIIGHCVLAALVSGFVCYEPAKVSLAVGVALFITMCSSMVFAIVFVGFLSSSRKK